jgi:hypothetical protein
MLDYLYQTNDLKLFVILGSILFTISLFSLLMIRWFFPLHLRYQENVVICCTSSLVIGIYGVLAGFATLYLINNNNAAADAVQRESSAVADLYRNSQGLNDTLRPAVQADIKNYVNQIIKIEWPQMNTGKIIADDGDMIINNMVKELTHDTATIPAETASLEAMLAVTTNVYDARHQRIQMSYSSLSNEIWVVIIIGTILTLCVSYLFGVNFPLHCFIAGGSIHDNGSFILIDKSG